MSNARPAVKAKKNHNHQNQKIVLRNQFDILSSLKKSENKLEEKKNKSIPKPVTPLSTPFVERTELKVQNDVEIKPDLVDPDRVEYTDLVTKIAWIQIYCKFLMNDSNSFSPLSSELNDACYGVGLQGFTQNKISNDLLIAKQQELILLAKPLKIKVPDYQTIYENIFVAAQKNFTIEKYNYIRSILNKKSLQSLETLSNSTTSSMMTSQRR